MEGCPSGPSSRTESRRARRSFRVPLRLPEGGRALAGRLLHFWIVWSVLLLLHEGGHALVARGQGLDLERVTVGVGPAVWRGEADDVRLVLRAVPLAGLTEVRGRNEARRRNGVRGRGDVPRQASEAEDPVGWAGWRVQAATLSGGVLATLAVVLAMGAVAALWERGGRRRCLWGRVIVADALVLTAFNLLPVPPLDGGRALLATVSALRGASLSADALFWLQVGGFALAVVPMALWTGWTRRIDRFALHWRAPERRVSQNEDSRRP